MHQGLSHAVGTLGVVAAIAVLGLARPALAIEVSSAELFVDRILGVQEQYAISASLRIDSANPIQSVSLYSQSFAGSFPLTRLSDGRWWSWAPGRILSPAASFDATITDSSGQVATFQNIASVFPSVPRPLALGLGMERIDFGWDLNMTANGADFYYVAAYDSVLGGPSRWWTLERTSPAEFPNMPDAALVPNHEHYIWGAANFRFDAGAYDSGNSVIRNVSPRIYFFSVPEPSLGWLVWPLVGISTFHLWNRRQP